MKVEAIEVPTLRKPLPPHANPEVKILVLVEVTAACQAHDQSQNEICDGLLKIVPLCSSVHPVALTNINIAVGDNANRKKTVQKVYKEVEANTKGANVKGTTLIENPTNDQNARNIGQANDAVNANEFVDQGWRGNLLDHPQDRNINTQYHPNSKDSKPVQELFIHNP